MGTAAAPAGASGSGMILLVRGRPGGWVARPAGGR